MSVRSSGPDVAPPLRERADALATLRDRVEDAIAGHGSFTLVLGEAGIGKSALLRTACEAARGVRVLWGACDALSTPRPLEPLRDIARLTGGELAAAMASDVSRFERFVALLSELEPPRPPSIVVIEDVHWADDSTRDLLVYLARRIAGTRAAVFVSCRDDELGHGRPLTRTIGSLTALGGVRRLTLDRLGPDAVAAMTPGLDASRVFAVTDGNPFFVTEIAATGSADQVPATVRDAVLARAASLSAPGRRALDAAALIPDTADVDLVRTVAGVTVDAVDECVRVGVLIDDAGAVRFRHELARLAIESAVPPATAREMHRRILAELARSPGADPARLAHHAERAGDAAATVTYATDAASRATRLGAHQSAKRQLERALAYVDPGDRAAVAGLSERLARECFVVSDAAGELAHAQEALRLRQELGNADDIGRAGAAWSRALWSAGRGDEARAAAGDAVAVFEGREPSADMAMALVHKAQMHMLAREIPAAIELGTKAQEIAELTGDTAVAIMALRVVGSSQWFVDPDLAQTQLRRSVELAERTGDDRAVATGLVNLGSGAGEVRRYADAERWLRETIEWCERRDLDGLRAYAVAWLARIEFERGEVAAAEQRAESVGPDAIAIARIVAATVLGRLHARRGDADAAALLDEAWRLAVPTADLQRLWPAAAGRAELAWLDGDAERIPHLVGDTYELAARLGLPWAVGELGWWLWRAGAIDAAPDAAAAPFAAQIRGDTPRAVALWQELGCPYEVALAQADSAAVEQVATAVASLDRLGARRAADLVAAQLRDAAGVRVARLRSSTATNPGGLTGRELDVALLLADGLTDAEIAARLHISPKTAGHHVSAILAKLGVPARAHAAAVVRGWSGREEATAR